MKRILATLTLLLTSISCITIAHCAPDANTVYSPHDMFCTAFNDTTAHGQEDAVKRAYKEMYHQDAPLSVNAILLGLHLDCIGSRHVPHLRESVNSLLTPENMGIIMKSLTPPKGAN